jgi:hypothetical protein
MLARGTCCSNDRLVALEDLVAIVMVILLIVPMGK